MRQQSSIWDENYHPDTVHLTISSSSGLIDKLVGTFLPPLDQHIPNWPDYNLFSTDWCYRMSMISALEMFHQVTQLDDWTLVLHCYIRQLNNSCNNGHCFCINKNISFIKRSQFSKIDRFIGGNLMKQKLTKDKGTRSQLKDVKSKLYKRYK